MSSIPAVFITPQSTLGEIVVAHPGLVRLFEGLGIDYCCGGKRALAEACQPKGLDPHTVAALLTAAAGSRESGATGVDAASMTLTQLADHIEETHHRYLKAELPRLVEMAGRVAQKHSGRDPRLVELLATVTALADEMHSHMQKEEMVLFPAVRQLEGRTAPDDRHLHGHSLLPPIQQMEAEHDSAGRATERLRELTDGFTPDAEACNTQRALLAGLAEFESDLHRHVHKENNILFPRALALTAAR